MAAVVGGHPARTLAARQAATVLLQIGEALAGRLGILVTVVLVMAPQTAVAAQAAVAAAVAPAIVMVRLAVE